MPIVYTLRRYKSVKTLVRAPGKWHRPPLPVACEAHKGPTDGRCFHLQRILACVGDWRAVCPSSEGSSHVSGTGGGCFYLHRDPRMCRGMAGGVFMFRGILGRAGDCGRCFHVQRDPRTRRRLRAVFPCPEGSLYAPRKSWRSC